MDQVDPEGQGGDIVYHPVVFHFQGLESKKQKEGKQQDQHMVLVVKQIIQEFHLPLALRVPQIHACDNAHAYKPYSQSTQEPERCLMPVLLVIQSQVGAKAVQVQEEHEIAALKLGHHKTWDPAQGGDQTPEDPGEHQHPAIGRPGKVQQHHVEIRCQEIHHQIGGNEPLGTGGQEENLPHQGILWHAEESVHCLMEQDPDQHDVEERLSPQLKYLGCPDTFGPDHEIARQGNKKIHPCLSGQEHGLVKQTAESQLRRKEPEVAEERVMIGHDEEHGEDPHQFKLGVSVFSLHKRSLPQYFVTFSI